MAPHVTMTKAQILDCLNEIGMRFARTEDPNRQHYKALGIAFGVAWYLVSRAPDAEVEITAKVIEELGLTGGSVQ